MENICHTFTGAALAKAGLERLTPLAMPTLLIGANLPDIDAVSIFHGPVAYLRHHRGITHSVVGVFVLSLLLALTVFLYDRWVRRRWWKDREPARLIGLIVVAFIGVGSHVVLDYTNSYGIRPFLPWSDHRYFGDLVFIVDPWLWLIQGGAVFLLTSPTRRRLIAWGGLWGLLAAIVLGAEIALTLQHQEPMGFAWLWFLGVGLLWYARWRGGHRWGRKLAAGALMATLIYWSGLAVVHHVALKRVRTRSRAFAAATHQAALPRLATPIRWDGLFETSEAIYYTVVSVLSNPSMVAPMKRYPKRLDEPIIRQALRTCAGATMIEFSRYLYADVEPEGSGYRVILRDARYARERRFGFGVVTVSVEGSAHGQSPPHEGQQ